MKMVYTHENRFLVSNAKNIIDATGIHTVLKNEYSAGAMGDLAPLDAWLEVWVLDDNDHPKAYELVEQAFNNERTTPWLCQHCKEENEAAFEICWHCENPQHKLDKE